MSQAHCPIAAPATPAAACAPSWEMMVVVVVVTWQVGAAACAPAWGMMVVGCSGDVAVWWW
jgi:hypothetical protein